MLSHLSLDELIKPHAPASLPPVQASTVFNKTLGRPHKVLKKRKILYHSGNRTTIPWLYSLWSSHMPTTLYPLTITHPHFKKYLGLVLSLCQFSSLFLTQSVDCPYNFTEYMQCVVTCPRHSHTPCLLGVEAPLK